MGTHTLDAVKDLGVTQRRSLERRRPPAQQQPQEHRASSPPPVSSACAERPVCGVTRPQQAYAAGPCRDPPLTRSSSR